jgi:hypothetical protein
MPKRPSSSSTTAGAPAEDGGRVKRTKFTKVIFDNTPELKVKKAPIAAVVVAPPTTTTNTPPVHNVKKTKKVAGVVKQKKAKVSIESSAAVASSIVVPAPAVQVSTVKVVKQKKAIIAAITVPTTTTTTTTTANVASSAPTTAPPVKKVKVPNAAGVTTSESKKVLRLKAALDAKLTAAGMTPEKIVLYHAALAAKMEHYRKMSKVKSAHRLEKSTNAEERLTLGHAMKTYLLSRSEFAALEAAKILIPKFQVNPHYACAAPMRLYLVSALQEVASTKYGGETGFAEKIFKSLTRGMGM